MEVFHGTELNIKAFRDGREKYSKCPSKDQFYGIAYCKLFHYTFDKSMDILHHCGSCKHNRSSPSSKLLVRSP